MLFNKYKIFYKAYNKKVCDTKGMELFAQIKVEETLILLCPKCDKLLEVHNNGNKKKLFVWCKFCNYEGVIE